MGDAGPAADLLGGMIAAAAVGGSSVPNSRKSIATKEEAQKSQVE